ncbi:fructoselysine 6-kinase [Citrobacter rodentium]|uniref:Fructoselysine kinase n=2 Tax=Citrobacter rodentium TaxID=67825 RepID=D2TKN1_CITRI|nr:fructoselysine 6-kinase [Citrobacter rodentium]KIQ51860.1 carbohydrate kinase [Citrobacter rodentium]QBY30574.1 fructoselysine 6-kinase [Citrobacter rodentium]UHO32055.1 fructoselysine 6-kinase [Citrobacter rodentium NBRC 105723 = DSM 16636]CBG90993.1 fructoselysine kinase [Citrobacter rodentium ICC168]HAT8011377.1 fructoselysine 6-kinase [Citrobacter rodentium NBRC 105723 = DSM 16636]
MSISVIGIGDNVVDKYLHSGIMYPGGNALNFSVYAKRAGVPAAFMGAFGNDDAAKHVQAVLKELEIDTRHCRQYEGENGYACIRLKNGDREFVTSNKNGVLRENPFCLSAAELDYISHFSLVHTSINGYLETELEKISRSNTVISFDFSSRGTGDYFEQVCPWVNYGFISCSGLTLDQIKEKISTLHRCGCQHVIATNGHECVYYFSANGFLQWRPDYIEPVDTLGAGDAFLTGFMLSVLQSGMRDPDHDAVMTAMQTGGKFSARVLSHYGAFGFGKPYRAG